MRRLSELESRAVEERSCRTSPYFGKTAVLTTMHGKVEAIRLPLKAGLGLEVIGTSEIDTDSLGTFTGEIERVGSPLETARQKARLGMSRNDSALGVATEGSFGPHPFVPFVAGHQEFIVFIDDELGIEVSEQVLEMKTNFGHATASCVEELNGFLEKARFPSHGLIVRPHKCESGLIKKVNQLVSGKSKDYMIHKGIKNLEQLERAIELGKNKSKDGMAQIETDMRAHMNPLRQRVIRKAAIKLSRRLQSLCPECFYPGFGITGTAGRLNCRVCGFRSEVAAFEIHGCAKCKYTEEIPRQDGLRDIDEMYCERCNP